MAWRPQRQRGLALCCNGRPNLPGRQPQATWVAKFRAPREMVDHMSLMRDFCEPFDSLGPGMASLDACESLFTNPKTERMIAGEYLVRRSMSTQQPLERRELNDAYWRPGAELPADGLTKVRGDMAPLLRILESGGFNPGSLRPGKGVAWRMGGGRV